MSHSFAARRSWFLLLLILVVGFSMGVRCQPDSDDDDNNNDASPAILDDDNAADDDSGDDDSADDDDNDNNDDNNNDNDNDNDNDNNDDNDNDDNDSTGEIDIEIIDGGAAGEKGVSIARDANGAIFLAATKGKQLRLYTIDDDAIIDDKLVCPHGAYPSLARDDAGHLHLSYFDTLTNALNYATNASGSWVSVFVDKPNGFNRQSAVAVDAGGNAYISYVANNRLKFATNKTGSWSGGFVDNSFSVESATSIVVDSEGAAHIGYYDSGSSRVKHATNRTGAWAAETVAESASVDGPRFMAMDAGGALHIAYFSRSGIYLRYATNATGSWVSETADNSNGYGQPASLWIDEAGRVYILYRAMSVVQESRLAVKNGSWSHTTLSETYQSLPWQYDFIGDGAGHLYVGFRDPYAAELAFVHNSSRAWWRVGFGEDRRVDGGASLVLETNGTVHIGYFSEAGETPQYAFGATADWTIEPVWIDDFYREEDPLLLLDATAHPHFFFVSWGTDVGIYHGDRDGAWSVTRILATGAGRRLHGALDGAGTFHLCYEDYSDTVTYLENSTGEWLARTIDTADENYPDPNLALDADGNVHVCFRKNNRLWYATNAGGSWVSAQADNQLSTGYYGSIAIDADGHAFIAHYDYLWTRLKLSENSAGSWTSSEIDNDGDVGRETAIVVDETGRAHILYLDVTNQDLKYATNVSGTWTYLALDAAGEVGYGSSMALDGEGAIHAAYTGDNELLSIVFPAGYAGR